MKNAEKLLKDIEKALKTWNEYDSFSLKGCSNLSLSDLDSLKLYASQYIANKGKSFSPYATPLGDIGDVLDAYGITVSSAW